MVEWTVGSTGVVVNTCAAHGTWFDSDEAAALGVAAARRRGYPAPDFSRFKSPRLLPAAIASAAAAIAARAITHTDPATPAAQQRPGLSSDSGSFIETVGDVLDTVDLTVTAVENAGLVVRAGSWLFELLGAIVEGLGSILELLAIF